jgi:hypothetical protein
MFTSSRDHKTKGGRNMGDPIIPDNSEKEKDTEGEDNNPEKEEKKKGRTYPRIDEISR